MFLREKTGKTAAPCSVCAEDVMKKIKKSPKKRTTLREDLGKYLLDLHNAAICCCVMWSKLVFGSIFLGSIRDVSRKKLTIEPEKSQVKF